MIALIIKVVLGIVIFGIVFSIFSSSPSKNEEETKRSIGAILFKCFILFFITFLLLFAWPDFGHPYKNPRKSCNANAMVIAGVLEDYYKKNGTTPDPMNLVNGKIDLKFLVDKKHLKSPITSFPDCVYLGFPYASGSVEVFCLSCGFIDQEAPTIHDEFVNRFAHASPSAARLTIDFSATKDCSQQEADDYFKNKCTFFGRFPALRELFGISKYHTVEKN